VLICAWAAASRVAKLGETTGLMPIKSAK